MRVILFIAVTFSFVIGQFSNVIHCISLGDKEQEMLNSLLEEFNSQPTHQRYNCIIQSGVSSVLPKVFIWCPIKHFQIDVFCPVHKIAMVFHCWTANVKTDSFRQPRLVYDLHGNIVFIQAIYRCPYQEPDRSSSRHDYQSASTEILTILPPDIAKQFPLKLFYRSACSQDLLDYVIVHIGRGHNFLELAEDIASLNFRAFLRHSSIPVDENDYYTSAIYANPSNDQLMHIFLAYFNSVESTFENEHAMTPCSILTCDHTFKVSKHVGVIRTLDKTFVNQFKNLFIGLNENGQVVNWRLTKTTAFEQIDDLLIDLKCKLDAHSTALEMIIVDDCCSVRPSYQRIFPDVPVKLDIFHACQRFVKTIPKGISSRKKTSGEFGLIFRQNGDTGEERTMNTPCPEDIECNMEMFLKRWECQLSEATLDSVRNLRKHIKKKCCSDIPPRAGTQKNERLHKLLKKSLLGGASVISPELAIAVLSVVMYIWSCKRDPGARKHVSNAKVIPVIPVEVKQQHLLSGSDFEHHLTRKFKCTAKPTEVPVVMTSEISSAECRTSEIKNSSEKLTSEVTADLNQLKNENVLNYVLLRVLHLSDVYSSIGDKCKNRDIDIIDFPFTDIERLVRVLHTCPIGPDNSLTMDMNEECLERNLRSFGLQRGVVPGDGDCCFASIATAVNKLVSLEGNDNIEFVNHLNSIGLCKSVESDTARLRQLFCQEIEANQQNYKAWVDFDIAKEIENFSQSGWFNSSLGDLCVVACSNILKTTIVVIRSVAGVPYIPFIPTSILTDSALYIAFNHSYPGHYDATKDCTDEDYVKKKTVCNCGAMAKSRQKHVFTSCDPEKSTCSCVKNGQKCSQNCRCVSCKNVKVPKKSTANSETKGCTCGSTKKGISTISCQNGLLRKSKCPCLKNNMYCSSSRCRCSSCGNKCEDAQGLDVTEPVTMSNSIKRKRCQPEPYKRAKGVDYLAKQGFEISAGPWTKLETLNLYIVVELIKSTGLTVSFNNVMELYNFVACSNRVQEMALPIAYKSSKKIIGKLSHINSKHSVFTSLMDSFNEGTNHIG